MQPAETSEQVYSHLADDPDLTEQVEQFVDVLPRLIAALQDCVRDADWSALGRNARQMKGSSACYGFDEISSGAAQLETACRMTQDEEPIRAKLAELERLCGRARAQPRPK